VNIFLNMLRIIRVALNWAIVGGFATAAMGLVYVVIRPDTGHIPTFGVPVMLGIPGFTLGLLAGAAFSCLAVAGHEKFETRLGERMLIGAIIGAVAGQIIVWAFSLDRFVSVVPVIIGAWISAVFGKCRNSKSCEEITS
jgi:hypothetical protein